MRAAAESFRWLYKRPYLDFREIKRREWAERRAELRAGLAMLPTIWSGHVGAEFERRGGVECEAARAWFAGIVAKARGRVSLASSDDDLCAAAKEAAATAVRVLDCGGVGALRAYCHSWGINPPNGAEPITPKPIVQDGKFHRNGRGENVISAVFSITPNTGPAVKRMLCPRWWLRRLRRAHGRRCEGAAIGAGVVRRGLWPYASQDTVVRRRDQRWRNARALDEAVIECAESGEALPLAEVVAGSIANPEVKRGELMVRIRGCDAIAVGEGYAAEFWTLTAPSRFHAQRIAGAVAEPNPAYEGATPKDAQAYLNAVWARARAAWKRCGLAIFGLRTAEPHHDGCPHWHLIAYGRADDLRVARWILKRAALKDSGWEAGARRHRFTHLVAKGAKGAAYAAKYVSKNINGAGMDGARDDETGRKISATVERVDAWAATWGIRQFQFFGCPQVSIWRALRRMREPVAVRGSLLERARCAADDADFAEFWRCAVRGKLSLIWRAAERLTMYGDAAAKRIAGVAEGARRALLPVKQWVIHWSGKAAAALGLGFGVSRSGVNNCTRRPVRDGYAESVAAVLAIFPAPGYCAADRLRL